MARLPDQRYGPRGNVMYEMTPAISRFLLDQNRYQMNLSLWKQYIIWKYTLGSGAITGFLLQKFREEVATKWTWHFFEDYDIALYGKKNIEVPFRKWLPYFEDPQRYQHLDPKAHFDVTKQVLEQFQRTLRQIISHAPKTPDLFYVYKSSKPYAGIPLTRGTILSQSLSTETFEETVLLEQKPFNSTTYNPRLNFDRFLDRDKKCCMFEILIPKGVAVLAISSYLHAHPYEKEILLPPDVEFELLKQKNIGMTFFEEGVPRYEVQSKPYHIGPIFEEVPAFCDQAKWYKLKLFQVNLVV